MQHGHQLGKTYASFIRKDLGIEVFIQVSGQIILLLLSNSKTATTTGLESLFKTSRIFGITVDFQTLLIVSICLSLKTSIFLHIKWIEAEKAVLYFTSKIIIFMWATFASARRLLAIISFFVPSLGLFDLLYLLYAAIMIIKALTVENLHWQDFFHLWIHSIENANIPFPWKDWDEGGGNSEDFKRRLRQVNREMLWTMLVNLLFHLMLLTPLFYTGFFCLSGIGDTVPS